MDVNHGKYLGVDYGDVRTGLAECDVSGMLAGGIGTIAEGGMRNTAVRVVKEAEARGCKKIIIGLPKNMDGSEGFKAEAVRAFAAIIATLTEIPIDFYDERMSTMNAYRFLDESGTYGKKRKEVLDAVAATVILENFMAYRKNHKDEQ